MVSVEDPPPGESHTHATGGSGDPRYGELAASDDFAELRRRYRSFVFPWTLAFMAWYLTFVLLSNWAPGLMDNQVYGDINLGLVLGLLQFASTFAIAWIYARHAARYFDPLADRIRARYDGMPTDDPADDEVPTDGEQR
ncbi:MAG: DUF485 domain-containing protein [Nocardioides sp.]